MKKLMIVVTAAVCAIGAYAAEFTKFEENFENYELGEWSAEGWTKVQDKEYTLTIAEEASKYLALETEPDGPLSKGIEKTTDNVYVDTKVKFTAFEDAEPTIEDGAKIAVWYKTTEEIPAEDNSEPIPATKGLWITAGAVDGDGLVTKKSIPVNCATEINPDTWYNLKIESVGNIRREGGTITTQLGFKVTINDNPVTIGPATPLVAEWDYFTVAEADRASVFPAITTDGTITALALAGTGAIDDITIDAKAADVEIPVDLTNLQGEHYEVFADPDTQFVGKTVTVTFAAEDGYCFAGGLTEFETEGTVGKNGVVTIEGELPKAEVVVAMVDGNLFTTLKAAFDTISEKENEGIELDIVVDCQYGEDGFTLLADDVIVIYGKITADKDGINLMTAETTLSVVGTLQEPECGLVHSGVAGYVAKSKYNEESDEYIWYLEVGEGPVVPEEWDDVTDDTPIDDVPGLDEGTKAAFKADGVTTKPSAIASWAKKYEVACGEPILFEAFLLDCPNTDKAIAEAKEGFKITAEQLAEIVKSGTSASLASAYPNAKIVVQDVTAEILGNVMTTAKLFQTKLVLK